VQGLGGRRKRQRDGTQADGNEAEIHRGLPRTGGEKHVGHLESLPQKPTTSYISRPHLAARPAACCGLANYLARNGRELNHFPRGQGCPLAAMEWLQ
jgi:hypothetical protein